MSIPITYHQWVQQEGTTEELTAKAILTDKVIRELQQSTAVKLLLDLMVPVFAKAIIKLGVRPSQVLVFEKERDASLRADEYVALMETIQGNLPIEYLNMAYNAWQQNYLIIKEWEQKSLSGYLQWWLSGAKRPKKQVKMVQLMLDEIDSSWRD